MSKDTIYRQAAIDAVCKDCEYYYNENVIQDIKDLPSAQPDWNEMIVMCDCCGHAIHVKRIDVERHEE